MSQKKPNKKNQKQNETLHKESKRTSERERIKIWRSQKKKKREREK